MSMDGAHPSSWGSLNLGVALGTPGSALHHLVQVPLWPHHPSRCPHDCLLTHQHLLFPLSGVPPTRNHVACFLTLFKALFQYHPSGTQCWTTQCKTARAPSFSAPLSCFIVLVNTYHLIRLYLLVSRLAVLRQWPSPGWNLRKAAVFHFVSHLSKPPWRMLGRNDKISGLCFKGFYRTKRCCVWESWETHVINGLMQNECLSFCYFHR